MMMLKLTNISFGYAQPILNEVNFTFNPGRLYFLLAKNGAGKSTLFRLLTQDLKPETGHVQAGGDVILHRQTPVYFEDMTVKENIECFLELLKSRKKYDDVKTKFALGEIESKVARKLSGGEKQRLYLAITEMSDDDIRLYDEADAALDAMTRTQYYSEVLQRDAAAGKTVIAISHHISESLKYADRICFLANQKLYEIDPAALPPDLADKNEDKIMEILEKECEAI
ncbi:ABC transporter ATP-binding protein [Paenibacillus paeoniae]|uniref:ABC transporter ATP-binding protein n=1 Tax=Paenibacillus paeoniae TaxID=2292705 RepID=A0A371PF39_9BACL|nr:ABC transporter ATP-binding protein [Paenibacillus paeoniae]REK74236.1 ABC transporter ATP-binding protein [Paenibacillus paeoniae]